MSTASLPSYHYQPQAQEQRLAQHLRDTRPRGNFVKNSKNGGVVLRLSGQHNDATLPEYGRGASVEGTVEIAKTDNVQSVEVKIDGFLRLKEIAEGGTSTSSLCLDVKELWNKDTASNDQCPTSLSFSLTLPSSFWDGKATYPLPPSFEAHLSGVPGFRANIDYSVSAVVGRSKISFFVPSNTTTVSTPFVYRPRSRPALPLPSPLLLMSAEPEFGENWTVSQTSIRAKAQRIEDVIAKFYLPDPRVFSMTEPIPFHVIFASSAFSLASFLPYAPSSSSASSPGSAPVRVQLLRQTAVDVRSITKRTPLMRGNNTDIWKTVQLGEGVFRHDGDGHDWMAWSGEVAVDPSVKVASFKASGLTVKDFMVLSMIPPDPVKSPFFDCRLSIPVRLTTDPWTGEFGDFGILEQDYSDPSLPRDADDGNADTGGYDHYEPPQSEQRPPMAH